MAAGSANAGVLTSSDGLATGYEPDPASARTSLTAQQERGAQSRMPMLNRLDQIPLPKGVKKDPFAVGSQAYGNFFEHPFTTKRVAIQQAGKGIPTNLGRYRAAGKLFMNFGGSFFICSASAVEKGMIVTAAHCVYDFGAGETGFADEVFYQPARHQDSRTFGTWTGLSWWVPTVYYDGTDECEVTGIVCANDVATVVLDTGEEEFAGMDVGDVTRTYKVYNNNAGYGDWDPTFSGTPLMKAAHITALGYPGAHDSGLNMMRSDSIGYQATPNNVIMGNAQTGGSSGGPWIQNFGKSSVYAGPTAPNFNGGPRVSAVTSWGYSSDTVKVQGSSRFGHNSMFPRSGPTNVQAVMAAGCEYDASKCY